MKQKIVRIIAGHIAAVVGRLDHEYIEMLLEDSSAELFPHLQMDEEDLPELMYRIQTGMNITIPDEDLKKIQTVGDLIGVVARSSKESAFTLPTGVRRVTNGTIPDYLPGSSG